jgi:hypothetical protein
MQVANFTVTYRYFCDTWSPQVTKLRDFDPLCDSFCDTTTPKTPLSGLAVAGCCGGSCCDHERKPTGTEKSNNRTRHKPEQASPPKATNTETKHKPVPAAQDRETSRTKARVPRPGTLRGRRGKSRRRNRPAREHTAHHPMREGGRATGYRNARRRGNAVRKASNGEARQGRKQGASRRRSEALRIRAVDMQT